MTKSLLEKLEQLKVILKNDERVILLNEIDQKLSNDEEVMKLSYRKDAASVEFEDALRHFTEDSLEVKSTQKKLYQAKLELDNHDLVKRYNKAYREVKKIYSYISKEIFGDFAL